MKNTLLDVAQNFDKMSDSEKAEVNDNVRKQFDNIIHGKPPKTEREKEIDKLAREELEEYRRKKKAFYDNPIHWNNNKRRRHGLPVLRGNVNKCRLKEYLGFHPSVRFFGMMEDLFDEINKNIDEARKNNPRFSWYKFYPELSRDTGGDILELIMFKNKTKLQNSLNFAADSLLCEWAYVIDLDKNTYEVYEGFNKEPLDESERFYFLTPIAEKEYRENPKEYYPVKFVTKYSLGSLPDEKDFLKDISKICGFDEEA